MKYFSNVKSIEDVKELYHKLVKQLHPDNGPRLIVPKPVKGKLSLWEYTEEIEFLPWLEDEEEAEQQFETYWKPLII